MNVIKKDLWNPLNPINQMHKIKKFYLYIIAKLGKKIKSSKKMGILE